MSRSRAPVLLSRLLSASASVTSVGSAAQLAAISNAFRDASVPLRPALPSLLNQLYRIDAAMVRPLLSRRPSSDRTCSLHSSRHMISAGHRGSAGAMRDGVRGQAVRHLSGLVRGGRQGNEQQSARQSETRKCSGGQRGRGGAGRLQRNHGQAHPAAARVAGGSHLLHCRHHRRCVYVPAAWL